MNFNELLAPVPPEARFQDKDYYIWGASMVRAEDGMCHLFYSRWPRTLGFEAWVTHSEVAHAISDTPIGPYRHVDVALPKRDVKHWDALCTHNPTVHEFDGQYYLYYMGNTGDGKVAKVLNWTHRNNQRIGVAVAKHPNGPWERFDQPLINVSDDPDAFDALVTSNPSVCRRPDNTYVLLYKAVGKQRPLPFGGPVVHLVATSMSPMGPFLKHEAPVFTGSGETFPAEDPFIWNQDGKYLAIVKDMHGAFTKEGQSLALFLSNDGITWELAKHPLVSKILVDWKDQGIQKLAHLERPQLWLENGIPKVLYCAASENRSHSFNVHIPLQSDSKVERSPI